jgi:hypothetical protein
MKKNVMVILLICLALPIFSQDKDSRAPFQGVWYGVIYDEVKVFFIFIDDVFISHIESDYFGRYSIENKT